MKVSGVAVVVALAGLIVGAEVQAEGKTFGLGGASCGEFVSASEATRTGNQQSVYSYMMWFAGYATMASGQTGIDYFKGTDTKSMQLWLENYCRTNPLAMFNEAAVHLMVELHKKQKS